MDTKAQTKAVYDAKASSMAEKFNAIGARKDDIRRAFSFVPKQNPRVLELGCGNGRDAKEICTYTENYVGIDYSEGLLSIAQKEVPEAQFKLADLEVYELPQELDVIFSFASLLHSDKDAMHAVLTRAYGALNGGGILFLSLKYAPQYQEFVEKTADGIRTFYLYSPEGIRALAPEFNVVFQSSHTAKNGTPWFEMILQKP